MTRERQLPSGWYPSTAHAVRDACTGFLSADTDRDPQFCAVVVPHAGWGYSGELACRTIARLASGCETVVVIGGHLRKGDPLLVAPEDSVATPLGDLKVNLELVSLIREGMEASSDPYADNTVEVQLPFIAHLLDMPRVVCLRCPPSGVAVELGGLIARYAEENPAVRVVGSTDLTHYGPSYGFVGHGSGADAVSWVREENDSRVVRAMLATDPDGIIAAANADRSACSAGAAAVAAAFAEAVGCTDAHLVGYHTSYDVAPNDSFVGYAGVGYSQVTSAP